MKLYLPLSNDAILWHYDIPNFKFLAPPTITGRGTFWPVTDFDPK